MRQINAGFTLIELMIVVAIIAILAAIAGAQYQAYSIRAQIHGALADITAGKTLFEALILTESSGAVFTVNDIGLQSNTPRCSTISLDSSPAGYIECTIRGNPLINGETLRLSRSAEGVWTCTPPASALPRHRPSNC